MSNPYMENDNGILGRDGKFHEIKPAMLNQSDKVCKLSAKLRSDLTIDNIRAIKIIFDPLLQTQIPVFDNDGNVIPDHEPFEAEMELLKMATGETEEQLGEWCDFTLSSEVREIYFGISNFKKKQTARLNLQT